MTKEELKRYITDLENYLITSKWSEFHEELEKLSPKDKYFLPQTKHFCEEYLGGANMLLGDAIGKRNFFVKKIYEHYLNNQILLKNLDIERKNNTNETQISNDKGIYGTNVESKEHGNTTGNNAIIQDRIVSDLHRIESIVEEPKKIVDNTKETQVSTKSLDDINAKNVINGSFFKNKIDVSSQHGSINATDNNDSNAIENAPNTNIVAVNRNIYIFIVISLLVFIFCLLVKLNVNDEPFQTDKNKQEHGIRNGEELRRVLSNIGDGLKGLKKEQGKYKSNSANDIGISAKTLIKISTLKFIEKDVKLLDTMSLDFPNKLKNLEEKLSKTLNKKY